MKKCLAFVLGGGGARGAMQVGALRALFEAGLKPDLLVGTSIGAANSAGLALWGMNLTGLNRLERTYKNMEDSGLMSIRQARLIWSALSGIPNHHGSHFAREFLIAEGFAPDWRFGQIKGVRLATIAANLHTGKTIIYGQDPEQSVLEGVLASTAVPPWFAPIEKDGHCLIDGGALSNLPIESALKLGATEIIALDLGDSSNLSVNTYSSDNNNNLYLRNLLNAVARREITLEMELAAARNVPVKYVNLTSTPYVQMWDFSTHQDLFKIGYETMKEEMSRWPQNYRPAKGFQRLFTGKQPSWLSG